MFRISDSEAGVEAEKSEGVFGEDKSGNDDAVGLLARRRRSLDILSGKKEVKQSASEAPGMEDGKGDEHFRCRSLLTICHRRMGFSEDDETRLL